MRRGVRDGRRDQQHAATRLGRVPRDVNYLDVDHESKNFTKLIALSGLAALGFGGVPAMAQGAYRQFSITMDDFHWQNAVKLTAGSAIRPSSTALNANSIKAMLFVIGRNIDRRRRKTLLTAWDRSGPSDWQSHLLAPQLNASATVMWKGTRRTSCAPKSFLKTFPVFGKITSLSVVERRRHGRQARCRGSF